MKKVSGKNKNKGRGKKGGSVQEGIKGMRRNILGGIRSSDVCSTCRDANCLKLSFLVKLITAVLGNLAKFCIAQCSLPAREIS